MSRKRQTLALALLMGCAVTALAGPKEIPVVRWYTGAIVVPADFDPKEPVVVVRTLAEYTNFVSRLPVKAVSMTHPRPDNPDPLLKLPEIDFTKQMFVAVVRNSMDTPKIVKVFQMFGNVVVQTEFPEHVSAQPEGMGTYAAVVITQSKGKVFVQPTNPEGMPNQ